MGVHLVKLKSLIDKEQIASKIEEVAKLLDREYAEKNLVIIMVLKGAICIVADLIRSMTIPCDIEVVQCKSYGAQGAVRGKLQILGLEDLEIFERDILIVDDIFDSGQTLTSLYLALEEKKP